MTIMSWLYQESIFIRQVHVTGFHGCLYGQDSSMLKMEGMALIHSVYDIDSEHYLTQRVTCGDTEGNHVCDTFPTPQTVPQTYLCAFCVTCAGASTGPLTMFSAFLPHYPPLSTLRARNDLKGFLKLAVGFESKWRSRWCWSA